MSILDSFKDNFGIHLKRLSELNPSSGQTEGGAQNLEEMGRHLIDDLIELSKNDAVDPEVCSLVLKEIDLFQRTLDYSLTQGGGDINQKRQEVAYVNKLFNELKESIQSELNSNRIQQNTVTSPASIPVGSQSINLDVYHSTSTGTNLETIKSFLGGIKTTIAKGYGQGEGFYVWTAKKLALNHFEFLKDYIKGYPLLIIINANINPDEWDIDYEVDSSAAGNFIFNNFDSLFKKIPDNVIFIENRGFLFPSRSRINVARRVMVFECTDDGGKNFHSKASCPDTESDISVGKTFGSIMNYLQQAFPEEIKNFEFDFFKRNVLRGVAIKYVGNRTLPVKAMEALVNGQWIDALDLLKEYK